MSGSSVSFVGRFSTVWESATDDVDSRKALVLMAPLVLFELLIFAVPFLILVRISLAEGATDLPYAEGTWSGQAYVDVLSSGLLRDILLYSFLLGVAVTVIAVTIGFFYAYAIWRSTGVLKGVLLFSVILPLLTTLVIRTYAFDPLLSPTGTLNELLLGLNLVSSPIQIVPNTAGVVVGQTYIVLPYAVLAIYSVLATMEWHVVEAARDLGASRPRAVLEVVIPQAMPGIIVATVISFAWSVGAYAAPVVLSNDVSFARYVEDLMLVDLQYPLAAAFSVVMLVLMLGCILLIVAVLNRFGGEFELA